MIDVKAYKQKDSFNGSIEWWMTKDGLMADGVIERTRGTPATTRRIWHTWKSFIIEAAKKYDVPVELIVATIATESGGKPSALRKEPGYTSDSATPHRISPGLMQTLISTASTTLGRKVTREELFDPRTSILAGTSYINDQRRKTGLTPPKVAAAYNSGSVYQQNGSKNRWKMRQYPIGTGEHVDRFVQWFNDIWAVFKLEGIPEGVPSFYAAFNGASGIDRSEVEEKMKDNSRVVKNARKSSFLSKLQAWFSAIFGGGAVAGTVVDRVVTTTDTTKSVFERLGIDEGLVLAIALFGVAVGSILIYLNQRKVIDARVEDEISGKTDSTEY